jgi:hypothetical protein
MVVTINWAGGTTIACPAGFPESAIPSTIPLERGNHGASVAVAEKDDMVNCPSVATTL